MEVSTIGLITLFPLHAVSLSMLGRLRYSKGVTAVIWGILCICCLTVTLLLKAFRPDLWVDSAYLITILLFFVCYAWLSEENTPQMVFLFFFHLSGNLHFFGIYCSFILERPEFAYIDDYPACFADWRDFPLSPLGEGTI